MQKKCENECKGLLPKQWYVCPYCQKKLVLYEPNALCKSVYIKCKKCGKEIEIKINQ